VNRLVVSTFPDQTRMDQAIEALKKLHSERTIKMRGSAVVTKSAEGKLSVQEITKEGHGGTLVAALIGALAGLAVGPVAAAITATGGAVIGNAADLSAEDDFNEFANDVADNVVRGGAVADVAEDGVTTIKTVMQDLGGTVLSRQSV
jgi:uncharacterized membrane protein